jgi:hypothetical protein
MRRTPGGWAGEDRLLLPDQDEAHCRADADTGDGREFK